MTEEILNWLERGQRFKGMKANNLRQEAARTIRRLQMDLAEAKAGNAKLQQEVDRLDHLHELDHSLAEQWQAAKERAEVALELLRSYHCDPAAEFDAKYPAFNKKHDLVRDGDESVFWATWLEQALAKEKNEAHFGTHHSITTLSDGAVRA